MRSFLSCTWGNYKRSFPCRMPWMPPQGSTDVLNSMLLFLLFPYLPFGKHCSSTVWSWCPPCPEDSVQWAETTSVLFSEHGPEFLAHEVQSHCSMPAYQKSGVSCKQTTMVEGWEESSPWDDQTLVSNMPLQINPKSVSCSERSWKKKKKKKKNSPSYV